MPEGHVYILGSTTGTLYTGVTSKFDQRIFEHRAGIKSIFASKYRCNRLLLHVRFTDIRAAIAREKQLKGWTRAKKLELITQTNPDFKDLAAQHGLRTFNRNIIQPIKPLPREPVRKSSVISVYTEITDIRQLQHHRRTDSVGHHRCEP
ncbi:MAG TPA: GIY-YIG nuclease family protein [Edaphobacter sp.]|nr:GIY-YIG nuclease family protein [Edaphobacter sp.]